MRLATLTLLFLLTLCCIGQTIPNFVTKEQAIEDLRIFEISLKEIHPNIYRYTSKTEFDQSFNNIRASIPDTVTIRQFYNLLAPIIEMIHCGHTFGITSFVDDKRGLLPLDVKILNDKIYVLRTLSSSDKIAPGSEIKSINGISAVELIQDFRTKSIGDGYGLTFKDRTIERDFKWKYATFISQPDSFKIIFKDYKSDEQNEVRVAAVSNESITKKEKTSGLSLDKPLDFHIDVSNDLAILKLRSFMAKSIRKQSGQKLKKEIRKSFKAIRRNKIDNLVIDVRWNTGGKAYAPPFLFSYLTDKPFKFKTKLVFRHGYRFTYPQHLNRYKFDDWVNKKFDRKINDSTYEWRLHKNTRKVYRPKRKAFTGKLYVVTNGLTASSGAEFSSLVDANGRGVFVGEETGGDYNGVNGYERTYLLLPNSKIGLLIAGRRSIMTWDETKNLGHGVIPTYKVQPTIEDVLAGQDAEIRFIYDLVKKR